MPTINNCVLIIISVVACAIDPSMNRTIVPSVNMTLMIKINCENSYLKY